MTDIKPSISDYAGEVGMTESEFERAQTELLYKTNEAIKSRESGPIRFYFVFDTPEQKQAAREFFNNPDVFNYAPFAYIKKDSLDTADPMQPDRGLVIECSQAPAGRQALQEQFESFLRGKGWSFAAHPVELERPPLESLSEPLMPVVVDAEPEQAEPGVTQIDEKRKQQGTPPPGRPEVEQPDEIAA